jgi:hypothetical protein
MSNTTSSQFDFRKDTPSARVKIPEAKSKAISLNKTEAETGHKLLQAVHEHVAKMGETLNAKGEAAKANKTPAETGIKLVAALHSHLKAHHGFPDAKLESAPGMKVEGDSAPMASKAPVKEKGYV